jgi:hypothetical protein
MDPDRVRIWNAATGVLLQNGLGRGGRLED